MELKINKFPELDYACKEAINTLCTNLSFSGDMQKIIMVTSCHAHEGKTFISMNLMRTLARLGKNVVLIDADLRRSVVQSKYGIASETRERNGLVNYLVGVCRLEQVIYETDIEGAQIVPVGRNVSNSLALLNGGKMRALLHELSKQFDYVIVDTPPVGLVIDAAEIAKCCTGTLFVVQYNETGRRELLDAKRQIERTGCPILGAVLNNVSFDSYSNKKYYNRNYYSHYNSDYYGPANKRSHGG